MTSVVITADNGAAPARLPAEHRRRSRSDRRRGTRRAGRVTAMTPSLAANSPTEGA